MGTLQPDSRQVISRKLARCDGKIEKSGISLHASRVSHALSTPSTCLFLHASSPIHPTVALGRAATPAMAASVAGDPARVASFFLDLCGHCSEELDTSFASHGHKAFLSVCACYVRHFESSSSPYVCVSCFTCFRVCIRLSDQDGFLFTHLISVYSLDICLTMSLATLAAAHHSLCALQLVQTFLYHDGVHHVAGRLDQRH